MLIAEGPRHAISRLHIALTGQIPPDKLWIDGPRKRKEKKNGGHMGQGSGRRKGGRKKEEEDNNKKKRERKDIPHT